MNVLELMLNDFVECLDGSHEKKVYAQVIAIEEGQDSILVEKDHTCNWFLRPEYLEPIPITNEILKSIGFNLKSIGFNERPEWWHLYDDYYEILVRQWSESIWLFNYQYLEMNTPLSQNTLCYVHELQHALRLCGLRELADNFKLEEGGEQ